MSNWIWRTFLCNLVVPDTPRAERTTTQIIFTDLAYIWAAFWVLAALGGTCIVIVMLLTDQQ